MIGPAPAPSHRPDGDLLPVADILAAETAAAADGRAVFSADAFACALANRRETRGIASGQTMQDLHGLYTLYRAAAGRRGLAALPLREFGRALSPHIERVVWANGRASYRLQPDATRLDDASRAQLPEPKLARLLEPDSRSGDVLALIGLTAAALQCAALAALFLA